MLVWRTFTVNIPVLKVSVPVSLHISAGVPIPTVKELLVKKLKKSEQATFQHIAINTSWMTLKTLNGDIIETIALPDGEGFLVELALPSADQSIIIADHISNPVKLLVRLKRFELLINFLL
jgi:hypothetical protein